MKKHAETLLIALFILLNLNSIQAQSIDKELNQVELIKQFIGSWKGEFGEDILFLSENKAFGNGIISSSQIKAKGKIIDSVTQLYGYDSKSDKFILAELKTSSADIEICSIWFTSEKTGEIIITNPSDAPYRFIFEFINPDCIIQTAIQGDKEISKIELKRIDSQD